ncbi:hypothetical protein EMMF5_003759 [Cystobasidiomycetes sp. EMM_F5]
MQLKVRHATSNDPWGPSGSEMNEIAQATYNQQDFIEIMETMDRRMNDKGKNWRHVFKTLTVLDYILHAGSENVVLYFQENIYLVKTLREFVFVDEDGKDQGANVRQKAKDIVNLLQDDARIRSQRRQRSDMRDRMNGGRRGSRDSDEEDESVAKARAAMRRAQERPPNPEDDDFARALEESKRSANADADRTRRLRAEEDDIAKAIRLSQEEEERRKRALEGNGGRLFDPDNPNSQPRDNMGWDSLLDPGPAVQPQPTGFASFNPYAAQQQQQQEEWMRQQQMLEMQRQMELQAQMQAAAQAQAEQDAYNAMLQQQALQQQQMLYQQQLAAQQMQMQQPAPLVPQTTSIGSNNPFAAFAPKPSTSPAPPMPVQPTPTPQAVKPPRDDGKHAHLASLLGNRDDGVDTFGNVGALRYGRNAGTNPFQRQQQQQQQQQQQNQQPLFEL